MHSTKPDDVQDEQLRLELRLKLLEAQERATTDFLSFCQYVWPEMLAALSETGWHNYSLFLDRSDATLIGYFETRDLQKALDGMAAKDVNERWQAFMADYFEALEGRRPDEGFLKLENIFYLN